MGKLTVSKRGKAVVKKRNDLFQVLKEVGVHVKAEDNVDAALIAAADRWMAKVANKKSDNDIRGVMMVSSKDGDFEPLLYRARMRGFVTASLTDEHHQTRKLVRSSDIIVGPIKHWYELMVTSSSSLSDDSYDDETSDESDESINKDSSFELRNIPSAPVGQILSSLASPSHHDMTIRAIPITDRGLELMEGCSGSANGDGESSAACWELVAEEGNSSDKHGAVGKASRMKILPSSMKQTEEMKQQTSKGEKAGGKILGNLAKEGKNSDKYGAVGKASRMKMLPSSMKQTEEMKKTNIKRRKGWG